MYGTVWMPYRLDCKVTFRNSSPNSSKDYNAGSWPLTYPEHTARGFSRSGDNASSIKGTVFSKFPGTVELVPVQVRNGPRLAYKVWSKRLQKYVWAREPITIMKLKRVKTKVKSLSGTDLPPNKLRYQGNFVVFFGGRDGLGGGTYQGYHWSPGYVRSYTGPLWTPFLLNGGSANLGPNPQNFMTSALSADLNSLLAELEPRALRALYSDVKNQKVNFAQALAERAQVASMIRDLCGKLVRAALAARGGNLLKAASILFPKSSKELANDVLVVQYGIRPLVSDIKGAIEVMNEANGRYAFDVVTRRSKLVPDEVIFDSVQNGGTVRTRVYRSAKITVKYKARVQIVNPFSHWLSETGLSDVGLLIHESIPFSFVLDWLLPLADYLKNKSAFSNLEIIHLHKTVFMTEYVRFERTFISKTDNEGYYWPSIPACGFINKKTVCNRTIITDNLPSLPLPSFKDPTSLEHIVNAIALIRQLKK